jgi:fatty acid desaturase
MEPLDTDLEYVNRREANPAARFNWLYIIPGLGFLWLLYLIGAAVFQWPVSGVVDPVMGFMIVLFFVAMGLLFWAMAPRVHR